MTIDEALEKIGEQLESILDKNEDALSWNQEIEVKKNIVKTCALSDIFSNEERLENMYTYEMFDVNGISKEKKIEMIKVWISALEEFASIEIVLDTSIIK